MSRHRYDARTDANERQIVDALQAAGYVVWQIRWPVDLLVGTPSGRWLPMEVKTAKGRLTEDQERFIATAGNCPTSVVRDAESAIRHVKALESQ